MTTSINNHVGVRICNGISGCRFCGRTENRLSYVFVDDGNIGENIYDPAVDLTIDPEQGILFENFESH